jgi:hypothetical protein
MAFWIIDKLIIAYILSVSLFLFCHFALKLIADERSCF